MNVTRTALAAALLATGTLLTTGMLASPAMAGPPKKFQLKNPTKLQPVLNPMFPLKPILPGGGGGGNPPNPNPPQQPQKPNWQGIVGSVLGGGHGNSHSPSHSDPGYAPGHPGNPGHGYTSNYVPLNSVPAMARYRLLVMNPASNDGGVMFVLRGREYRLPPGAHQELNVRRNDVIRFDRGNGHGIARYSIHPGTYIFRVDEYGWNVYRKTIRVTIDNRDNRQDFTYLMDRRLKRLPSGEITRHVSRYPIQITFDPGNGDPSVHRQMIDGMFRVGMNGAEHRITLQRVEPIDELALAD